MSTILNCRWGSIKLYCIVVELDKKEEEKN